MATVTFDDGTNPAVVVQAPRLPEEEGRDYPILMGRTMGGAVLTADQGDGSTVHIHDMMLHFRHLTNANYTSLKTFFETYVIWSKTKFTYTDPHATAHTNMHYVRGMESFRSGRGTTWNGDIVLTKDMAA